MDAVRSLYDLQNSMIFTPCCPSAGPTGGAGVALPAGICNLTTAMTFFAMPLPLSTPSGTVYRVHRVSLPAPADRGDGEDGRDESLDFLDLTEVEFDRGRPAEDAHQHADLLLLHHHLVHHAGKVHEGPRSDPHLGALLEGDAVLRRLIPQLLEQPLDLQIIQRDRPRAGAHESCHARGVA